MRPTTRALATALGTTCLAATGLVAAPRADGATPDRAPAPEHCVVEVTSRDPDGQLHLTDPVCAESRSEVLRRSGLEAKAAAAAATFAIGIHYDGPSFTGSSLMVVGADCTGGWLNTPAGWGNRISSTQHGCPRIRHFDGYYLVTPQLTTLAPGGNLGAMDDRTSSIQYLP